MVVKVAALYVQRNGAYYNLPDVDPWDADRDARLYAGPYPVVAHPPCTRWCMLAGLVEARYGYKQGDDGGCFAAALAAVRKWGGVLEHPAHSKAWPAFGLPKPSRSGGWQRGACGGWSCSVEQGRYGHPARKATWLYAFGCQLPELRWGSVPALEVRATVSWCGNKTARTAERPRLSKKMASATPPDFRAVLLTMAASASVGVDR